MYTICMIALSHYIYPSKLFNQTLVLIETTINMVCEACSLTIEQALTLFNDHFQTYIYLVSHNVLPSHVDCVSCGEPASLNAANTYWGCQKVSHQDGIRRRCSFRRSITYGTWMANSHLSIQHICKFVLYFLTLHPPHQQLLETELNLTSNTIVSWSNKIRDVLFHWCLEYQSAQLGGPGEIVEVDEAKFGHTKYHRGRKVKGQWVFGGYERGSKRIFIEPVKDRTTETLLEIIHRRVKPGTTIISDCWPSYNCLSREGKYNNEFHTPLHLRKTIHKGLFLSIGYTHLTVNHQLNFVDPITRANTQSVERTWRSLRSVVPTAGRRTTNMVGYLSDYQFRRVHTDVTTRLHYFFTHLQLAYNPQESITSAQSL